MHQYAFFAAMPAVIFMAGCGPKAPSVLGAIPPEGASISIGALKQSTKSVLVKGVMVEKCPVAGCWFILRDNSGTIKVDTKDAGFVVTDVPLNTKMTVSGKFKTSGESRIVATGLRY